MPYITQEERPRCDKVVRAMVDAGIKADGDLNYILFKFFKYYVPLTYGNTKNYCAELNECAIEIRRKFLANYEDEKERQNGKIM